MFGRFVALVVVVCSGCDQPTEIVVSIDSDLDVPKEMKTIGLGVAYTDVQPLTTILSKTWEVDRNVPNAVELPATIGLLPGESHQRPIEVTVGGYLGSKLVLDRKARLTFVEERVLRLSMDLLRSCIQHSCPSGQTCGENGCQSPQIDPNDLPDY